MTVRKQQRQVRRQETFVRSAAHRRSCFLHLESTTALPPRDISPSRAPRRRLGSVVGQGAAESLSRRVTLHFYNSAAAGFTKRRPQTGTRHPPRPRPISSNIEHPKTKRSETLKTTSAILLIVTWSAARQEKAEDARLSAPFICVPFSSSFSSYFSEHQTA